MFQSRQHYRKNQHGGFAEYPDSFQTKAELAQFGPLPDNSWASGLGKNPGLNDQISADTIIYKVNNGGSRKKQHRSRKQRSKKNIYLKKKI